MKLELYGLFYTLKATQLYTIGIKCFIVEMDAKFIKGMINNPMLHPNDAVNCWIAAILLFDFELIHIPAVKHTGADGLSCQPAALDEDPPNDSDELEDWIDSNTGLFIESHTPPSPYNVVPPLLLIQDNPHVFNTFNRSSSSLSTTDRSLDDNEIPCTAKAMLCDERLTVIHCFLTMFTGDKRVFTQQAHGKFIVSELTMNSPWACWVNTPSPPVVGATWQREQ